MTPTQTLPPEFVDFGASVALTDVDEWVIATLRRWLPTYLGQAERERGMQHELLLRPKASSYANTLADDEFLDHALPAIVVTTARTLGQPKVTADGGHETTFQVAVSAVLRGKEPPQARLFAAVYAAEVRRVLVQQGSLGHHAKETRWLSENVNPVFDKTRSGRYLAAGMSTFAVFVDSVVNRRVGPLDPENEPYEPLPEVGGVTVGGGVIDGFSIDVEPK